MRVLVAPYSFLLSVLILAILVGMYWCLIVILICIFPLMNIVLNIFYVHIHHLNIFCLELFVFLLLSCKSSLHILDLSPLPEIIAIFYPCL